MKRIPVLILHGGAGGGKNPARHSLQRKSLERILKASYAKLLKGGAVDAVILAVSCLEDDALFNAGTGAQIQSDGHSRLSASVMDGARGRFAGVINLENILNPVQVAKSLLEEKHRILEGDGAFRYAQRLGFRSADTRTPASIRRWQKSAALAGRDSDTVGACALDARGRLACATSTGGLGGEIPGRVSDSAMPAGNYADKHYAVSATGIGEEIVEDCLAAKLVIRASDGLGLKASFQKTFAELDRRKRRMGAVGLDSHGNLAWNTTLPVLRFAWKKGSTQGLC